jgi:hypothetical protein
LFGYFFEITKYTENVMKRSRYEPHILGEASFSMINGNGNVNSINASDVLQESTRR